MPSTNLNSPPARIPRESIAARMQEDGLVPKKGDLIIFNGNPSSLYPNSDETLSLARRRLEAGKGYLVSKVELASSWCAVWLEGCGDGEEDFFPLSFFEGFPKKAKILS